MNAVRIRNRLDSPIPQLPELAPLIGRDVEIIVLDDSKPAATDVQGGSPASDEFWNPPSLEELAARQGVKPITSIEQLHCPEIGNALDGFEEAVE